MGEEERGYVLAKLNYRDFPLTAVHHHKVTHTDSSSSSSEVSLNIPEDAKVKYSVVDGAPGLSIAANRIRTWAPIASRTQARSKNSNN